MSRFGQYQDTPDLPINAFCKNKYEFTLEGGKGGSTSSSVEIPKYLEEPLKRNIARAEEIQQIGYMPYYGPDVAAFTPMQQAAFQAGGQAGEAFGFAPRGSLTGRRAMSNLPDPQTFAGGLQGYSSGGLYDQAVAELAARRPGQAKAYSGLFTDPVTGAPTAAAQEKADQEAASLEAINMADVEYIPIVDPEDDWVVQHRNEKRLREVLNATGMTEDQLKTVNIGGKRYYAVSGG